MRMPYHLRALAAAVLASAILCGAQAGAEAQPALAPGRPSNPPTFKMKVTYSENWIFRASTIPRCVKLNAYGAIYYKFVVVNPARQVVEYEDIKLTNPTITAKVYRRSKGRCTARATLTKIKLGQYWTGYSCSYNPSLSVSVPWAVSFAAWPSCGNRNQAGYTTTYGKIKPDRPYVQGNSGSPTIFGDATKFAGDSPPCYGVISSTVAYVGGSSDSYGASNGTTSKQVCLKKHG
jgi:hypothetical protein